MDAVVYLENPVVGKTQKFIYRDVKNIDVVGDQFQLEIDDGPPILVTINNNTHIHFYKKYLNQ